MIGVKLQPISSGQFFNAPAVMKALSEAKRKVLSKFGAHVRTRARSSIKPAVVENRKAIRAGAKAGLKVHKRFRPSAPGEPPRTRRPGAPIKRILFGYDAAAGDVLIGFGQVGGRASMTPARLERGGEFTHKKTGKVIRVLKRPTMVPAMEHERSLRMPAMFADSLRPV